MRHNDRLSPAEVQEGDTIEAWIDSNRGHGGTFAVTVRRVNTAPFGDSVRSIELETQEGATIKVYWPNAHAESRDLVPEDGSMGQLTGFYPIE